jgi:hypothetical protein
MTLKQDERALLQLVCERGQSYEDLAGLLGISEREVREKARAALSELGGADPDSEVGLTDYLLGQADPIGRADAVRYLQQEPEALELAETILTTLRALAPGADLPTLPEPRGRRRKAAAPSRAESATGRDFSRSAPRKPKQRTRSPESGGSRPSSRLIAGLAGAFLILLFVFLAVAGVFDSGDGSESAAADPAEEQRDITPVTLEPQNGSGVGGLAEFGLANDQLFVDLEVDGLDPELGGNKAYVLWMMLNENAGYPVTLVVPGANGSVRDRFAIPTPVAVVVGGTAQFVVVSESPADELQDVINTAVEDGAPVVPFAGETLARGRIPAAEGNPDDLPDPGTEGQPPAPEGGAGGGAGSGGGNGG